LLGRFPNVITDRNHLETFMKKPLIAALLAASFLVPQVLGAKVAPQANVTVAAPEGFIQAHPALWVLKDEDTTIYLFGTIHILRSNINWFDGQIKSAFEGSSEVVLELLDADDPKFAQVMLGMARDKSGVPLTKRMKLADANAYKKAMVGLGVPYTAFEGYRPWFVSVALSLIPTQRAGFDPNSGVEAVLKAQASKNGKALVGLETGIEQIGFFDKMSDDLQIAMLNGSVKDIPNATKNLDQLVDSWVKGDVKRLAKLMNAGMQETPEVGKILLTDRNARWAGWIDKRMEKPGTVFLAVGAGHLAGKGSVQDFLKSRHFTVSRVKL
jgi:uncharacterized protein